LTDLKVLPIDFSSLMVGIITVKTRGTLGASFFLIRKLGKNSLKKHKTKFFFMAEETKFFVKFFRVIRNKKVAEYVPSGATMLDIGCGSDYYLLREVSRKIRNGIGIDIAVRNRKENNITIRKAKISEKLLFKSGTFDVATMIAFIEHLDKPEKMISEVRRVLKKGGIIIITTPMGRAKPFWELLVNLGLTEEKTTEDHKQYFSPERIEGLLVKNGFDIDVSENFEFGMNYIAVGKKK